MNPKGTSPLTGIICLWSGAIVDIPDGWFLCDGNNGTPDLTDRFVVGAGDNYNPDDVGGVASHNHALTMDSHYHWLTGGNTVVNDTPNGNYKPSTNTKLTTGSIDTVDNRPPYYALCYIMKS